jgi:hypothetical protein
MFVSEANSGAAVAAAAAVHLLSVAYSKSLLSFPSVVVSLSPAFFTHATTVLVCILHPKLPFLYNEQAGVMMMMLLPLLMLGTK